MITLPNHWFVQPSYKDYVLFANDKLIPWRVRARLINLYRRLAKGLVAVDKDRTEVLLDPTPAKPKLGKRFKAKPRKGPGSKKNSVKCNLLKVIVRHTSSGKGRTSRKKKITFRVKPLTIHLKGNKYNGGFRISSR